MLNILWQNIFKKNQNNLLLLLKKGPLFKGFNKTELTNMVKYFHLRKFLANEIVFNQESPSYGLYFIKSGKIQIHNSLAKKETDSAFLQPGDFFNEIGFIDQPLENSIAVAVKDTELLVLLKSDFQNIIERKPYLAIKILQNIAYILKERLLYVLKKC